MWEWCPLGEARCYYGRIESWVVTQSTARVTVRQRGWEERPWGKRAH